MLSGRNGTINKIASQGKKDAINKNQPSFCKFCIDFIYWIIIDRAAVKTAHTQRKSERGCKENNVILIAHSSTHGGGFCLYRRGFNRPVFFGPPTQFLIPVAAIPRINCRWPAKNSNTTGTVPITTAAINNGQLLVNCS
jgi:hypothetical protein